MGFPNRVPRKFIKTVTFDGTAGAGTVGTVAVGTVTGSILFTHLTARVKTSLVGAATIEMGVAGNTAALIAQSTATDLDANEFWQDATPESGVSSAIVDKAVKGNLILTVGSDDITAGVIEIVGYWLPLSDDGALS